MLQFQFLTDQLVKNYSKSVGCLPQSLQQEIEMLRKNVEVQTEMIEHKQCMIDAYVAIIRTLLTFIAVRTDNKDFTPRERASLEMMLEKYEVVIVRNSIQEDGEEVAELEK